MTDLQMVGVICDELAVNIQISVIHKENSGTSSAGMSVLKATGSIYGLWMATT
jgi:hypothetical protein